LRSFCSTELVALLIGLAASGGVLKASSFTIDFEGLADSTILSNQYTGLAFSNAIILTAGISLNEFEFPPHSGTNVASDNNGPMSIMFSSPITSFSGYFTYAEPLTLQAFDSASAQVASVASVFSNNEALSGDVGSSPNEFLKLTFAGEISSVTITGDPGGGSFVLDDATFTNSESTVPEPATAVHIFSAVVILAALKFTRRP
jgi:hypothetical protein